MVTDGGTGTATEEPVRAGPGADAPAQETHSPAPNQKGTDGTGPRVRAPVITCLLLMLQERPSPCQPTRQRTPNIFFFPVQSVSCCFLLSTAGNLSLLYKRLEDRGTGGSRCCLQLPGSAIAALSARAQFPTNVLWFPKANLSHRHGSKTSLRHCQQC